MSDPNTEFTSRANPERQPDLILGHGGQGTNLYASDYSNRALAEEIVVPVTEERIEIGARQVETGRVRVTKTVRTHEESVDEPILREHVSVERVVIGRPVSESPGVRYEGDVMIVPVVEEELVVTRQLVLKEELRITRTRTEERSVQTVTLRSEEIAVERIAGERTEIEAADFI